MPFLLSLLSKYWPYLLLALFVAGAFTKYEITARELHAAQAAIVIYKQDITTLTSANKTLSSSIDTQNTKIAEMGEVAKQAAAAFVVLNSTLVDQHNALSTQVDKILKAPKPTTCEGSIDSLRQFAIGTK